MLRAEESLAATLRHLFGPRLGAWVSAAARKSGSRKGLAALWWRGRVALVLAHLCRLPSSGDLADFVLALHLHGAALSDLADVSGIDEEQLHTLVLEARQRSSARWVSPCSDGAALVARWRDRSTETQRLLLAHTAHCQDCRSALAASREADQRFLAATAQPAAPAGRPISRFLRPVAVLTVLALVVGASFPLVGRRPASHTTIEPAGLMPGPFVWLGSSSPYSVAFELGHRQWVPVLTQFPADAGGFRLLSPDGRYLAAWTPDPPREPRWLDLLGLDGTRAARWRWDRTTTRRPLAWLDGQRLLVRETPVRLPYERDAEFLERLRRESRLLAFDAMRGQEETLVSELVADAVPAPDGTVLALVRPLDPTGPGATAHTVDLVTKAGAGGIVRLGQVDSVVPGDRPLWFPDSSRVVVIRRPAGVTQLPAPTELVMLDRSGHQTLLIPARPGLAFRPLAVAPDGSRLYYAAAPLGQNARLDVWELRLATGERRLVLQLDRANGLLALLWLGDQPLFVAVRTLPAPPAGAPSEVTELALLTANGVEFLATVPGRWGFDAWGQPLAEIVEQLPVSSPTVPLQPAGALAPGTLRLAPGGRWFLAPARAGELAVWDAASGIQLTEPWPLREPSWHPSGLGFFAIGTDGRIRLVSRSLDGVWQPELVLLDDPRRGSVSWVQVGPDGRVAALSRSADGTLVLWTAFLPRTTPLRRWRPGELNGLPCATWQRAGTLLVAAPLPDRYLEIHVLDIMDDQVRDRVVTRFRPFLAGAVERCWVEHDPAERVVAVRARRGTTDAIVSIRLDDPQRPLLLASGPAGNGLAWAPDGSRLAYALGTTLTVSDRSGRAVLRVVTEVTDVLWVDRWTLWGLTSDGERQRVVSWSVPRWRRGPCRLRSLPGARTRRPSPRQGHCRSRSAHPGLRRAAARPRDRDRHRMPGHSCGGSV